MLGRALSQAFLALLGAAWLQACSPAGPTPSERRALRAIDITGATYAQDFALTDHVGQRRSLADYRGRVVLVFFGFAQCPDVCPTALAGAAETLALLGADGSQVQVLFVTLDPERDTAEVLEPYVTSFHRSFVALRADVARTEQTARDFKVSYRKVPMGSSYTIDHSALVYAFDRSGHVRLALRPGQTPAEQAADLRPLLAASPASTALR